MADTSTWSLPQVPSKRKTFLKSSRRCETKSVYPEQKAGCLKAGGDENAFLGARQSYCRQVPMTYNIEVKGTLRTRRKKLQ